MITIISIVPVIDSDDVFDTLTTGKKGHFDVRGEEREQDGLEPYIRIDHSCGAKKVIGRNFSIFWAPKDFWFQDSRTEGIKSCLNYPELKKQ